jgi:hypothetical protein
MHDLLAKLDYPVRQKLKDEFEYNENTDIETVLDENQKSMNEKMNG